MNRQISFAVWVLVGSALLCTATLARADWLEFRGSNHDSVARGEHQLPVKWTDSENIAWKSSLPGRGPSSPIVIGDKVVVTASSGVREDRLHVLCFDAAKGKRLWHRQFWATGHTYCHPESANAAPSPASDGELIFAFFSSNDMVCLDLEGNLKWLRGLAHDYPLARNDVGMSSSPVVAGDVVVVQVENQGESFVAGLSKTTGETVWDLDRDKRSNWSSPLVQRGGEGEADVLLLMSPDQGVSAHDPSTGAVLWSYNKPCGAIASPVIANDVIYVPSKGITSIKPNDDGDVKVQWQNNKLRPGGCSPLVYKDRVLALTGSILVCADVKSGDVLWRLRLNGGRYWATPVIVDDHLYAINYDGVAQTVRLKDGKEKAEIVGESSLGEKVQGSPAISYGAMFIRSDKHLWKIASPER